MNKIIEIKKLLMLDMDQLLKAKSVNRISPSHNKLQPIEDNLLNNQRYIICYLVHSFN